MDHTVLQEELLKGFLPECLFEYLVKSCLFVLILLFESCVLRETKICHPSADGLFLNFKSFSLKKSGSSSFSFPSFQLSEQNKNSVGMTILLEILWGRLW